jgi:hypothetical protein
MLRFVVFFRTVVLLILTGAACFVVGVHASIAAFAAVFSWPMSEPNLDESTGLGRGFGLASAVISLISLCLSDRKLQGLKAVAAVLLTWLVTYACVWLFVVSSLG